jgi:hypothetical protein
MRRLTAFANIRQEWPFGLVILVLKRVFEDMNPESDGSPHCTLFATFSTRRHFTYIDPSTEGYRIILEDEVLRNE